MTHTLYRMLDHNGELLARKCTDTCQPECVGVHF